MALGTTLSLKLHSTYTSVMGLDAIHLITRHSTIKMILKRLFWRCVCERGGSMLLLLLLLG